MKDRKIFLLSFVLITFITLSAKHVSAQVVISEVYGGGGNAGATYTHDFIELANYGVTAVNLSGWSVQYASATGTSWQVTNLSGTIQPGGFYLVQEAQGAGGTTPLPTPDATGTIPMSATAGKVALVNTTTALSGSCPTSASIIDFVGFGGTANCFEGTGPTPAPSNTTSVIRVGETNDNSVDFSPGAPNPQNSMVILAAPAQVGGRVIDSNGNGISKILVKISGGELSAPLTVMTNPFGYYNFEVPVGQTYFVTVNSKNYAFSNPTRVITVNDNVTDLNFTADER